MSKGIAILTEILIAVAIFTAGVAAMYQWDLRHPPKQDIEYTICNRTSEVIGRAFSASYEVEKVSEDEQVAEEKKNVIQARNPVDIIRTEAEASGVDPDLAEAIARLETGHFTSTAFVQYNNVGGLSDSEVPRSYSTIEEGIAAFIDTLEWYVSKGMTTPETMCETYCPPNSTAWAQTVRALM